MPPAALKLTSIVGRLTKTKAPAVGAVMEIVGASPVAVTLKPFANETSSVPVRTRTARGPTTAAALIASCAVILVGLFTVTGPKPPSAAPPTDIPAPKLACVVPCEKLVFCAMTVTETLCPT